LEDRRLNPLAPDTSLLRVTIPVSRRPCRPQSYTRSMNTNSPR
jgi:hypothetical protein